MKETINQIINGYINSKTNEESKQNPMQQLILLASGVNNL